MSILDEIRKLESHGLTTTVDYIVENHSIKQIKEYIYELQSEIKRKDEKIKELVIENANLEVRGSTR